MNLAQVLPRISSHSRALPTLALLASWVCSSPAFALAVPALHARVTDQANLLTPEEVTALSQRLEAYERGSGHQFAILTLPSLEGEDIESFSMRVVEEWQLGREGIDDGLLVLVVKGDRKMRIEVGYGLEGEIPDVVASRIIREVMTPAFRSGDFYGGLDRAITILMQSAGGEALDLPAHEPQERGADRFPWLLLLLLLVGAPMLRFVLPFGMFLGGGTGFGGHRGGGFGGGGSDFGGGFSGGGGDFGGGGASGDW